MFYFNFLCYKASTSITFHACGKNYFFYMYTSGPMAIHIGYGVCCDYGLKLFTPETLEEFLCVQTALRTKLLVKLVFLPNFSLLVQNFNVTNIWTSATYLNKPTKPVWCSTEHQVENQYWNWTGGIGPNKTQNGITAIKLNNKGLAEMGLFDIIDKHKLVCEPYD